MFSFLENFGDTMFFLGFYTVFSRLFGYENLPVMENGIVYIVLGIVLIFIGLWGKDRNKYA